MESTTPAPEPVAVFFDIRGIAALLQCSTRHVQRLAETGQMPAPVKLGALSRWPKPVIEAWIEAGCKPVHGGSR